MEKYLKSFNTFTDEEIEEALQLGTPKSIKKGEHFFTAGNVCTKVAFVYSGIFRHYYFRESGEAVSYCFTLSNNFVAPYSSFISQEKTIENIQAITDAELFEIRKADMDRLINTRKNWLDYSRRIAEKQYIKREKRIFILQKEKAKTKYEALLNNTPEYVQQIPLQYLASYLGITQRHLSRMRKEVSF